MSKLKNGLKLTQHIKTTMIYARVLNQGGCGVLSSLDAQTN
jgi:hypothetical protein